MVRLLAAIIAFAGLTLGAMAWAESGTGLTSLDSTVATLRAGSVRGGRVYVGGGLRSGK